MIFQRIRSLKRLHRDHSQAFCLYEQNSPRVCLHVLPEVGETAECSAAATAGVDVAALLVRDLQAGRPGGELHQLHDLDAVGLSDLLLQHPAAPSCLASSLCTTGCDCRRKALSQWPHLYGRSPLWAHR